MTSGQSNHENMNIPKFLPLAAVVLLAASCAGGDTAQTSGIRKENMDLSVSPGESFYDYATKGWQLSNPMPDIYSRYTAIDKISALNQDRINQMVSSLNPDEQVPGSNAWKIATLYKVAMDSVKLNEMGWSPLEDDFARIDALASKPDVFRLLGEMHAQGIGSWMRVGVGADEMDSKVNALSISQGGLSMSSRDYYLDDDANAVRIRTAFKQHVQRMYELCGFDSQTSAKGASLVLDVETRMAKAFRSPEELRDPMANYNKMGYEDFRKAYPDFAWDTYFKTLGLENVREVVVGQPASLKESVDILSGMNLPDAKLYLKWKLIDAAASCLSDDIVEENFDFNGRTVRGTESLTPRWRRSVSLVSGALGEAVGQIYVTEYFPPEAKQRMVTLVENLRVALGERIASLEWMSDETKAKAQEKLDAFTVKIGYPDKWKDYSTLDLSDDSYWANMKRYQAWETQDMVSRLGKPVDRTEWFMSPQTVNAYYNPTSNEICFPAGILQYPFFDMEADDAFNYGAIGVVIGHEMTHGFDDQGRLYDKEGNLKEWWTKEDADRFKQRAQVLVDFFNAIEVAPGVKANGEMTLGENIADHGGLKIAYQALQNATKDHPLSDKDGLSPSQRFYLAFAGVWAGNIRDAEVLSRTKTDVHSLARWRVDGSLPHIDSWYEAYGIKESDPLFVPKKDRANVW